MFERISGNDLRRKRAFWPAGALGLLLALALMAGSVLPALAQGIPPVPWGFSGTVSTITPPQLVPEGTLVQAFLDGVLEDEDFTDAGGQYWVALTVPWQTTRTLTFRVAGVLAYESASLTDDPEIVSNFDLTIDALPAATYDLTMAVAPAGTGTATDVTGASPYGEGIEVSIRAVAETGYGFIDWTASPAVTFADPKAAETRFTMPASAVTVTANFGPGHALTMAVNPAGGGSAIDVQGRGEYAAGGKVSVKAQAAAGYEFVGWSAAPSVEFADASATETTFTMVGAPVTITANFESAGYVLTLAASPIVGGTVSVVSPVPPKEVYEPNEPVTIQASPASGYQFSHWTAGGGTLGNPNMALTIFTMPAADVSVFATFTLVPTSGAVCFIATAAYGSPGAEQIDVLREFRDRVLLNSAPGSQFVALYYRLSPPVAEVISGNSFLRTMVRELLVDPLVWMVEATGDIWRS